MTAQAVRPTPSPLCSGSDNSSAVCPAPPRLLHVVTTMTAQPRALPSCSGSNDSSATHPAFMQRQRRQLRLRAPPHLLCAAVATTAQTVRPTPSPSCSGGGDSSGVPPPPPPL